jgi:hypothetical protein
MSADMVTVNSTGVIHLLILVSLCSMIAGFMVAWNIRGKK